MVPDEVVVVVLRVVVVVVVDVVVVVVVVEVAYSSRVAVLVRLLHFSSGHWQRVQPSVKSQDWTGDSPTRPQPRAVLLPSRQSHLNDTSKPTFALHCGKLWGVSLCLLLCSIQTTDSDPDLFNL